MTRTALSDPGISKGDAERARKAATRARAQLVGLLRKEGKFDEAYAEVTQLIQDNPNALEPQLEKGRILQTWAEKDPRHYDEAVSQWIRVRNWLYAMRKKPPEYFEVIYNAAFCLYMQGAQSGAKAREKLLEARKLLNYEIVVNPKLNGPDMAAKYKALLEKIDAGLGPQGKPAGKR
jgi:tetratricopeptide (TPR) repeat protein